MVDTAPEVTVRPLQSGAEVDRILDQLELRTGLRGRHRDGGRHYDLSHSRDWVIGITSMRAHLDAIAPDWRKRLHFALEL